MFHSISFQSRATGSWERSDVIGAAATRAQAIKAGKWLAAQKWVLAVKVHNGQPGEELIAEFKGAA